MLLSRTSRYALRATAFLAGRAAEERPTPVAEIAAALGVPRNYLSKVLQQLARRGLLVSERGPRGGFRLASPPEAIRLLEVVETVEPRTAERDCLLGRPVCSDETPCAAHSHWREVSDAVERFLGETTLAELARPRDVA